MEIQAHTAISAANRPTRAKSFVFSFMNQTTFFPQTGQYYTLFTLVCQLGVSLRQRLYKGGGI
ncbi:MAG: hypothetical protein IJC00_08330, partial [Clostridia bacterium]|nr:hypothetical protein [Clostridia bacterium]